MAQYRITDTVLTRIANAVRRLIGGSAKLSPSSIAENLEAIGIQSATTITPTTSAQTAVAKGKYTSGAVTVGAIPSQYVDTTNIKKTANDLTVNGATIGVPAGYYANNASKSVSTTTLATPTISVSDSGLITATETQSAGYVSAGTKTATQQLSIPKLYKSDSVPATSIGNDGDLCLVPKA